MTEPTNFRWSISVRLSPREPEPGHISVCVLSSEGFFRAVTAVMCSRPGWRFHAAFYRCSGSFPSFTDDFKHGNKGPNRRVTLTMWCRHVLAINTWPGNKAASSWSDWQFTYEAAPANPTWNQPPAVLEAVIWLLVLLMCERRTKGLTAFPLLTSGDGPTGQPGQLKEANRQAAESQRPLGRFPPGLTLTYGLSFHQCFIFDCFHCLLLTHSQHFLKGTPTLLFVCGHIYSSVESPASSSTAQLLQYLVAKWYRGPSLQNKLTELLRNNSGEIFFLEESSCCCHCNNSSYWC